MIVEIRDAEYSGYLIEPRSRRVQRRLKRETGDSDILLQAATLEDIASTFSLGTRACRELEQEGSVCVRVDPWTFWTVAGHDLADAE